MTVRILAFTERGLALAERIAGLTDGTAERCRDGALDEWTARAFESAQALIYVGAAGIAVRAIAPYIRHKTQDPAVLVIDETGRFVIPVLSGHIGGANELAEKLAAALDAVPVITTATDRNGLFAADVWAKKQHCAIPDPARIKAVSAKLLRGEPVRFYSEFPVSGEMPAGIVPGSETDCDFALTIHTVPDRVLACVPNIVVLGIGCKKGISAEQLESRFRLFLAENRLQEAAVRTVCTIDRKKDEPGLLTFCESHGWKPEVFSAEQLRNVPGAFSASGFVAETVGVDNVCERSAVFGSGGSLLVPKNAGDGVTIAAAVCDYSPSWE